MTKKRHILFVSVLLLLFSYLLVIRLITQTHSWKKHNLTIDTVTVEFFKGYSTLINKTQMGKAQSSFLRVEPFAALSCLSALYSTCHHLTQPAAWPSTMVQAACPFIVMLLPVLRWRVGSTLPRSRALLCPIQVLLIFGLVHTVEEGYRQKIRQRSSLFFHFFKSSIPPSSHYQIHPFLQNHPGVSILSPPNSSNDLCLLFCLYPSSMVRP